MLPKELILEQILVGPMENFSYFIGCARTKNIAIVDPAWEVDSLCEKAEKNGYKITHALLTHGHYDHTDGVGDLLKMYDIPVIISKYESRIYKPKCKNLVEIDDHQRIKIGDIEIECIWAPGHASGCQCFLYKNILITGDVLFVNGCGRCDLPGGDANAMYDTLYNKIMKLPDEIIIYPGHRYGSRQFDTLANQKKTNPYLKCNSREEFLSERMGL